MKVKSVFIILTLLLLGTASAGCSLQKLVPDTPDTGSREASAKNMQIMNDAAQDAGLIEPNGSSGVVTDTVVDVFRDPGTKSERVTQAIYNQPVTILEEKDNWFKVAVVDSYTGWVKSKYIDKDVSSIRKSDYKFKIVVTAKTKKIFSQLKSNIAIEDIVMGTELYSSTKLDGWYEVALPGRKTGWIDENGSIQLPISSKIPLTGATDFVLTAKKLKGTTYLWGGISAWGIDCSGLTYICARVNGVNLPRDAAPQYAVGEKVSGVGDMKPGDLVFFNETEKPADISHIGIYIGSNQYIHASKSRGAVIISSTGENYFKQHLVGIRRVF